MKLIKIISLNKGDWIIDKKLNFFEKRGKFTIGRVKDSKIEFDKIISIDMDKKSSREDDNGYIEFEMEDIINKLSKKDLKDIKVIEKKMKITDALDKMNKK